MSRLLAAIAAVVAFISPVHAQNQPGPPVGLWRCVVNSPIVSIDLQMQVTPGQYLEAQGSIVYVETGRIYQVRGPGRWLLNPPGTEAPGWLYSFQMQPADGNHAMFSWFAAPTGDPRYLANTWQNPQTGQIVQTNCQRLQ